MSYRKIEAKVFSEAQSFISSYYAEFQGLPLIRDICIKYDVSQATASSWRKIFVESQLGSSQK